MGSNQAKHEVKVEKRDEIKNYPKKQYYSGKKCKKVEIPIEYSLEKFSLDGDEYYNPKEEKKLQSPKKKTFKEQLNVGEEFKNKIINLQQMGGNEHNEGQKKTSPRLKVNRHSICYDGEFALKLQQSAVDEKTKTTEKRKSLVKDLSFFEPLKVIGRGTFGKVVLVRNKTDKQLMALKCLKKVQILKNKNIENIKNEKKILEKIDHPFIIKMRFTFQSKDKIYMAFDYYNGGELFFHLQKHRRFSENLTKFYAAEIYLALSYLHSKGIIYRDLKPENIILDRTGHIKLIDFGLAKEGISFSNLTATICGTNEYIPPEVICGKSYGFNFDWWGFGSIIYEMLYGHPAYSDESKAALFKKIVNKEPNYKGIRVSDEALDLLKSLLNKDPSQRIKPDNIKYHPWFKGINFDEILGLKTVPPFVPKIKNEEDLSNIDPDFLNEAVNSPVKSVSLNIDQNYFSDF